MKRGGALPLSYIVDWLMVKEGKIRYCIDNISQRVTLNPLNNVSKRRVTLYMALKFYFDSRLEFTVVKSRFVEWFMSLLCSRFVSDSPLLTNVTFYITDHVPRPLGEWTALRDRHGKEALYQRHQGQTTYWAWAWRHIWRIAWLWSIHNPVFYDALDKRKRLWWRWCVNYDSAGLFFPYSTCRLLLEKERGSWCGIVYCKERSLSSNNENGISVWDIIYGR